MNPHNCNYYAHICNKECAHILISAIGIINFVEIFFTSYRLIKLLSYVGILYILSHDSVATKYVYCRSMIDNRDTSYFIINGIICINSYY